MSSVQQSEENEYFISLSSQELTLLHVTSTVAVKRSSVRKTGRNTIACYEYSSREKNECYYSINIYLNYGNRWFTRSLPALATGDPSRRISIIRLNIDRLFVSGV